MANIRKSPTMFVDSKVRWHFDLEEVQKFEIAQESSWRPTFSPMFETIGSVQGMCIENGERLELATFKAKLNNNIQYIYEMLICFPFRTRNKVDKLLYVLILSVGVL